MMLSGFTLYKFIFTTEFLVSEAVFGSRLKKRKYFFLRLVFSVVLIYSVVAFLPLFRYDAFFGSLFYLAVFSATLLSCVFLFEESFSNIVFISVAAYTFQHIAYLIYSSCVDVFKLNELFFSARFSPYDTAKVPISELFSPVLVVAQFDVYFLVYYVEYFAFARKIKGNDDLKLGEFRSVLLAGLFCFVTVVFNMITEFNLKGNAASKYLERIYNLLACFLVLYFQFGSLAKKKMNTEMQIVNQLLYAKNKQYEDMKRNIEVINVKCHDLKKQILLLGEKSVTPSEVEAVRNAVEIYDSYIRTGNEALDVILTEKSLICEKHKISLVCSVAGNSFDFMTPSDLYALFGNALDNAVEASVKAGGEYINCFAKRKNSFVSVHIENLFSGEIQFEKGLPKTVKSDKDYHGFGLLSIKTIVAKYSGELSITVNGNVFNLDMVFFLGDRNA